MTEYRRLTAAEEQKLARHARGGNQTARHRLFESQQAWVIKLARRWHIATGCELDDLISTAYVALLKAIDHFDPTFGTRLSTYVAAAVKQELINESKRQQRPFIFSRRPAATSDDPVRSAIEAEQSEQLQCAIRQLPPRWRKIVKQRMQGHTFKEIGQLQKRPVTLERARQIHKLAVERLAFLLGKAPPLSPRERDSFQAAGAETG